MKKTVLPYFLILIAFTLSNCEQAEEIKESFDTLECANLLIDIDERWDDDDVDCSEIKSDIDKILKSCGEFLDAEDKAQLEFYKANCSDD
ncbi:hypothetical protein [Pseudozobellia thermophila]|uniref:Lipoprotein n=1 Tax=Pseudozobellia thermophila TaxID=192903 RepID=A0A1M6MLS8_9FLAO|nr:hypothetical protein [Pseudozobellia thermophila]SHJ84412.1 hypothetical protein SAMN04488513_11049 [Pseudozobellia thermophila]